ncbi:hypothetical protein LNN86_14320 [Klebsiella pneumoniae subsp. pneumoniae]|nr:hypothetical protein [Klebsiella pneumoniae subsp. pneumoniae]
MISPNKDQTELTILVALLFLSSDVVLFVMYFWTLLDIKLQFELEYNGPASILGFCKSARDSADARAKDAGLIE